MCILEGLYMKFKYTVRVLADNELNLRVVIAIFILIKFSIKIPSQNKNLVKELPHLGLKMLRPCRDSVKSINDQG